MIFDVMIKSGKNAVGKDVFNVYRVRDSALSAYLRKTQDDGQYIVSVIPLFRSKLKDITMAHYLNDPIVDEKDGEVRVKDMIVDPVDSRIISCMVDTDRLDRSCIDSHGF